MSLAPHAPKKRQYAAGETQVYYGSPEGQNPSASLHDLYHDQQPQLNPEGLAEPQHIDLMTYPPDPRDLHASPPEIRLPPGSFLASRPPCDNDVSSLYQSSTLNAVPTTEGLLHELKIPLGLVVSPYRTLADGEEPVPVVDDGVIARCRKCRAYINPYVQFVDGGNRSVFP